MPYKSEKIDISGTMYDRRVKLTHADKEEIKELYQKGGYSYKTLADMFGVSKSLIGIIINPATAERVKKRVKEHWQDYRPDKDEWAKIVREHRRYKEKLYKDKKIGVNEI